MGINSGKFTPPSFGSAPAWCQYEHESMKIVALMHKVSPFTAIRSGFGPIVGLWLDYLLYLLMGIDSAEVCASPKIFFWAGRRRRSRPVPVGLQAEPSNLLMHIDWAKLTLATRNSSPGRHCLRWSLPQQAPTGLLISTNAHRVGKNDRMPPKNLSSGRAVGP